MTEPREIADAVEVIAAGVWHWRIHNSNIGGGISSSHAVTADGGSVLIDPVRLSDGALETLPPVQAILLSATCHQRAAWRYQRELGVEVWLPEDARPGDQDADRRYSDRELLPGGVQAIRTPGPERPHYSFLRGGGRGVLFCSDLLLNEGGRELEFVPAEYHEDPAETRRSVERLLDLDFSILCLDHGVPVTDDPKGAIRDLLAAST